MLLTAVPLAPPGLASSRYPTPPGAGEGSAWQGGDQESEHAFCGAVWRGELHVTATFYLERKALVRKVPAGWSLGGGAQVCPIFFELFVFFFMEI